MILEVEDGMFAISALGGGELTSPTLSGLVVSDGRPVPFITVQARDQSRPVRVHHAALPSAPPRPEDFDAMVEFSLHNPAGLLVGDLDGGVQRVLTRISGDVRVRVLVNHGPRPRNEDRLPETFTIEVWPAPPAPTIAEDRAAPGEPEAEDRDHLRTTRPGDLMESEDLTTPAGRLATGSEKSSTCPTARRRAAARRRS